MKKSYLFFVIFILSVLFLSCNVGVNDSPVVPETQKEVKPNIFGKTKDTKNVQNSQMWECGDTTRPY
jgi:hypothetical protein